jgi:hypothetical protein
MATINTDNGVCQIPGAPDGTPIPVGDPCRGVAPKATANTTWLVGLDDNSNNVNDDDFWDVFLRLTFGPDQSGWLSMRYEYLGGETAHHVAVKIEEQWVPLSGSMDLNPVRAGDTLRIKIKDFDGHSVGIAPDPGVIWSAQIPAAQVPEPSTLGMFLIAGVVLVGRLCRRK